MKVNRKAKLEKKITYSNLSFAVHLFGYSSLKTGRERRRWEVIDHPRLQSSWLKLKINWIKKERYWDAIITAYGSSCLHSFHHSPTFYLEMKTFLSSCPSDSNRNGFWVKCEKYVGHSCQACPAQLWGPTHLSSCAPSINLSWQQKYPLVHIECIMQFLKQWSLKREM